MCVAARTGLRKQMLELIDRGAAVDATGESGITALGLEWRGQLACVQALLEKRADLHRGGRARVRRAARARRNSPRNSRAQF